VGFQTIFGYWKIDLEGVEVGAHVARLPKIVSSREY